MEKLFTHHPSNLRVFRILSGKGSFRDNAMETLAHKADIHDLHIAKIRFGGDIFLQPGTERFAEPVSEDGEGQCKRQEEDPPTGGFGSSKRHPGKGRREKRRGDEVGAAAGMYSQAAFTRVEPSVGFVRRGIYILNLNITKQEETGGVGMPCHGGIIFA